MDVDLLVTNGLLLTMDTQRRVYARGALAIAGGTIVAVGRSEEVAGACHAAEVIDAGGGVVHPGLVDAHAHTVTDLIRGFTPKGRSSWVEVEQPFFDNRSPTNDFHGTALSCMEMVANGITTYCDTGGSAYLDATCEAIDMVGLRGLPGPILNDRAPKPEYRNRVASTAECLAMLDDYLGRPESPGSAPSSGSRGWG